MNGAQNSFHHVDGIRARVQEAGSGPPLLLVHGLGGSQMWRRIVEPLASRFRLIIPDLPGFWESECPPVRYSPDGYAQFLRALLKALGIESAGIIGISFGGEIAARFCHTSPETAPRLMLVSSTGLIRSRWIARHDIPWRCFSFVMKHGVLKSKRMLAFTGAKSFNDIRNRPDDFVENYSRQLLLEGRRETLLHCARIAGTSRADFPGILQHLHLPTLILWGANDRVVPVAYASAFRKLIPGAEMSIVDACGHSIPLENPDEFCRKIFRFFTDAK